MQGEEGWTAEDAGVSVSLADFAPARLLTPLGGRSTGCPANAGRYSPATDRSDGNRPRAGLANFLAGPVKILTATEVPGG